MSKIRKTMLARKHDASDNESTTETWILVWDNDGTLSYVWQTGAYYEAKELARSRRIRNSKGTKLAEDTQNALKRLGDPC